MTKNWKTAGLAACAAMALAACSSESESEDASADAGSAMSVEEAAQEFSKLEKPQPGQYSLKVDVTSFEMPGAPEGMLDQMRSALEGAYGEGFCLTPEEADKGFEEQLGQVAQNGECNFSRMDVDGGQVSANAVCDVQGGTMTLDMDGTVSATGSDIVANTKMDAQGQTMEMTMRMVQTRTGDCAA